MRGQTFIYYGTVFVTGAAVLILEISAVRMLSPHFGTSMFVLSSVLTVVLAALSLGYFFGGHLSDRLPHHRPLYAIITIAGLCLMVLYTISIVVFPIAPAIVSIIYGPLILSLFFFFVPAFLLGIDSPYVIKLLSKDVTPDEAGAVVGKTFFWSTLGSIVGSIATGFFLIPFLGIKITIISTALALCALGVIGSNLLTALGEKAKVNDPPFKMGNNELLLMCLAATFFAALALKLPSLYFFENQTTLFETDGRYSHIRVVEETFAFDRPPLRILQREVNSESAIFQDSYEYVFGYTNFADLYEVLQATTSRYLVLGGGAYTIPRTLVAKNPTLFVDVAELDPTLFPLAQKYFDLKDTKRITNHVMDARVFVKQTGQTYDVIFGDAFNSGHYIPQHLSTEEFFHAVKEKLNPEGIFMVNMIGARNQTGMTLTGSFAKTLQAVFPNVRLFTLGIDEPNIRQNLMFIAKKQSGAIDISRAFVRNEKGDLVALADIEVPLTTLNLDEQIVFTDDRAPVEYLVAKQLYNL